MLRFNFRLTALLLLVFCSLKTFAADVHFSKEDKEEFLTKAGRTKTPYDIMSFNLFKESSEYPFVEKRFGENMRIVAEQLLEIKFDPICMEEIKKSKKLPPITLIGEIHDCPNCYIEKIKKLEDVKNNKICFGLEGENCNETLQEDSIQNAFFSGPSFLAKDTAQENLFGVEGISYHVSNIFDLLELLYLQDSSEKVALDDIEENLGSKIYSNLSYNLLMAAMSLRTKILDDQPEPLVSIKEKLPKEYENVIVETEKYLSEMASLKKKGPLNVKEIDKAFKNHFGNKFTNGELFSYFENIFRHIFSHVINDPENNKYISKRLIEIASKPKWSHDDLLVLQEAFKVSMRNRSFVRNIIEKYCENLSKKKDLPIFVQMGAFHALSVNYMLQKHFAKTAVTVKFDNHYAKFFEMPTEEKQKHVEDGIKEIEKP